MKEQNPVVEIAKFVGKPVGIALMAGVHLISTAVWIRKYFEWLDET